MWYLGAERARDVLKNSFGIVQHAEEKDLSEWTAGSAASTDDAPLDRGASDEPDWLADWASKKVAGAHSFFPKPAEQPV